MKVPGKILKLWVGTYCVICNKTVFKRSYTSYSTQNYTRFSWVANILKVKQSNKVNRTSKNLAVTVPTGNWAKCSCVRTSENGRWMHLRFVPSNMFASSSTWNCSSSEEVCSSLLHLIYSSHHKRWNWWFCQLYVSGREKWVTKRYTTESFSYALKTLGVPM